MRRKLSIAQQGILKIKGKGRVGSPFDGFLDGHGIRAEVEGRAVKEIIADQIAAAMNEGCGDWHR